MCTIERLGGRLDCLFGEVMLIRMSILYSILMNNEHLKKMVHKYSFIAKMFNILCAHVSYDECNVILPFSWGSQPETCMEIISPNNVCAKSAVK